MKTLWMGDLPYWMDESYVYNMLNGVQDLMSVKIIRNKVTSASEGYGFIEFRTHEAAEASLKTYGGQMIPGTEVPLRVNWAVGGGRRFEEGEDCCAGVQCTGMQYDAVPCLLKDRPVSRASCHVCLPNARLILHTCQLVICQGAATTSHRSLIHQSHDALLSAHLQTSACLWATSHPTSLTCS